jgi:hypothetical protein
VVLEREGFSGIYGYDFDASDAVVRKRTEFSPRPVLFVDPLAEAFFFVYFARRHDTIPPSILSFPEWSGRAMKTFSL